MKNVIRLFQALAGILVALVCAAGAYAGTFYVDSVAGIDTNSGTAPSQPWRSLDKVNATTFQPGDRLLFKAGSTFNGQLKPRGSGKFIEDRVVRIVVDRYGDGERPRINGEGKVRDAVLLQDVSAWEIRGLEVTNLGPQRGRERTGIRMVAHSQMMQHLILANLFVHDVNGELDKATEGCGIFFESTGNQGCFSDLIIEKCRVVRADRNGICQRHGAGPRSTQVVIRNNEVENVGGDGIKVWGSDGSLIEHNLVRRGGQRAKDASAGIWPFASDNTLIQFNEVCLMKGTQDGQGFDSDWACRRSVFQYNYSHDNEGGFMLVCSPGYSYCEDTVVRYNISQNDGTRIFNFGGGSRRTSVYNNTIYVGANQSLPLIRCGEWVKGSPSEFTFANNLFIVEGSVTYELDKGKGYLFDHNAFIGKHEKQPTDRMAITAKAPVIAPGTGKDGFTSLGGYRLRPGAPWKRGISIGDNGGRDFFGKPLPKDQAPSVGATQSP